MILIKQLLTKLSFFYEIATCFTPREKRNITNALQYLKKG